MPSLRMFGARCGCVLLFISSLLHGQTEWKKYPSNPIIPNTIGGGYAFDPVVLYDSSVSTFRMWFTTRIYGDHYTISTAISTDGINWFTSVNNPILDWGSKSFEAGGVWLCSVIHDGTQYRMYYSGIDACNCEIAIGLATSTDGIEWTKYDGNPILTRSQSGWDSSYVRNPKVRNNGSTYFMYYTGSDVKPIWSTSYADQIGMATSSDGIVFSKHAANPIVPRGDSGSWDDAFTEAGSIVVVGGTQYLFYTGARDHPSPSMGGLAISNDGVTWSKYHGNPILVGDTSGWDWVVKMGTVLLINNMLHLWYSGSTQYPQWSTGYATAVLNPINSAEDEKGIVHKLVLSQNYPNPFNPKTEIGFQIPVSSTVSLTIFNLLGEEVATLVDEEKLPGSYAVEWNADGFPSGVYFYRMTAGEFTETKKLVLIR